MADPSNGKHRKRRRRTAPGSPPGTITVDPAAPKPAIRLFSYGPDGMEEASIADPAEVRRHLGRRAVTWVNVDGLGDAATVMALGEIFGIHKLALEDVVNVHQRPKVEDYGEHLFIVGRMAMPAERFESEQISFFLGRTFVLTFQETKGDCFDLVRERIRKGKGQIRTAGPAYLTYALVDALLDYYFPLLERLGDRFEELEREIFDSPTRKSLEKVHLVRRDLLNIRRVMWPMRDALGGLVRESSPLIPAETRVWLRDCHDHSFQILDATETWREMSASLVEAYLSSVSNRMNEIMKVLTMISTIFIPLTFVAGVYGMNFQFMPETKSRWGYPLALAGMTAIAVALVLWFRRRGWLSGNGK